MFLKKEQFERGGQRGAGGGLGVKRLEERVLTHPRQSKTQNKERKEKNIIKMKKCLSKSRKDEARRAPFAVSHTHQPAVGSEVACGSSAGTGKRGSDRCMPLTRIRA